jgi:hypothetical protein
LPHPHFFSLFAESGLFIENNLGVGARRPVSIIKVQKTTLALHFFWEFFTIFKDFFRFFADFYEFSEDF